MSRAPIPPWTFRCPHCEYALLVFARGAHGKDPGAGVEAALVMRRHVASRHRDRPSEAGACDRLPDA